MTSGLPLKAVLLILSLLLLKMLIDLSQNKNTQDTRENRFEFLVRLLGLTSHDVSQILGHEREFFVSDKDAFLMAEYARKKEVSCSKSWIIDNSEIQPSSDHHDPISIADKKNIFIIQELEYLKHIHSHLEFLIVDDDSMLPQFTIGDYVGGNPVPVSEYKDYLDFPCIVFTEDDRVRLRRIGYHHERPFLYGTNTRYRGAPFFEDDPKISILVPIFWHRFIGV